jgi:hypothetical protein
MSHRALQRAVVRLLHDPALVDRLTQAGAGALGGDDLSQAERSWLESADPRAFVTDPYRQARVLTALVEELPTATAMAYGRLNQDLTTFFGSPLFHGAIDGDERLGPAFGAYLSAVGPDVAPLAELELALMDARRAPSGAHQAGELVVAPDVHWLAVAAGCLAAYGHVWAAIRGTGLEGAEAVLRAGTKLAPPPALTSGAIETLLLEPDGQGGHRVGELPDGLRDILDAVVNKPTVAAARRAALSAGASPEEVGTIIASMIEDGLLVQGDSI